MSISAGLRGYYHNFGLRGVLAISSHRLLGVPKEIQGHAAGTVNLRLRTSDLSTYSEILLRGEYEFALPFTPRTIVDAGANIGMASVYFANRYPEAKIIAVEAESSNFEVLVRNVRPYPNVVPVNAALWNRDGSICVSDPDPATGASGKWGFVTSEGNGARVRAVTMRTLMREHGIESIDLAKIDIEGAEREVFEDTSWIRGLKGMMIELHDRFRPGCSDVVDPAMQAFTRRQRGETTLFVGSGYENS